jgi:ferric-dicitrate binding protein FerR (iron transport regulator)
MTGKDSGLPYLNYMKMENISVQFDRLRNSYRIAYLLDGFLQKNLSTDEQRELDKWILKSEQNMQLFEDLTDEKNIGAFLKWYESRDLEKKLRETKKGIRFRTASRIRSIWRYAAAACILAIIGLSIYYLLSGKKEKPADAVANIATDIQPGSEYATLKLDNGKLITLNSKKDSVINDQIKIVNGELVYANKKGNNAQAIHELVIPRKGFYKLVLPDGTRVWLNSESTIRYPNEFEGSERRVDVSGETYFEVAKDPSRPFIVTVNGFDVRALGTEFNINAYKNEEDFRATLVQGVIKVSGNGRENVLKPNQELSIRHSEWKVADDVETGTVTAWKDNQFKFKNTPIEQIMRDAERWYDADVIFQDKLNLHLNGTIGRDVPVSKLLHVLSETGEFHFKIEGRKITITK